MIIVVVIAFLILDIPSINECARKNVPLLIVVMLQCILVIVKAIAAGLVAILAAAAIAGYSLDPPI